MLLVPGLALYGVWLKKWNSCFIWSVVEKVKVHRYVMHYDVRSPIEYSFINDPLYYVHCNYCPLYSFIFCWELLEYQKLLLRTGCTRFPEWNKRVKSKTRHESRENSFLLFCSSIKQRKWNSGTSISDIISLLLLAEIHRRRMANRLPAKCLQEEPPM